MKRILLLLLCFFILLSSTGCKNAFEYQLVAEGCITRIEIINGGFMTSSKRVFYIDKDSFTAVFVFGINDYEDIKIGDCIYIYNRDWDGRIIKHKPLEE